MIISDADYESNLYVTKVDAEMRADCVSSVSYSVTLCLPKGKKIKVANDRFKLFWKGDCSSKLEESSSETTFLRL